METKTVRYLGNVYNVLGTTQFGDRTEYLAEDMNGVVFYLSKHKSNENLFTESKEPEPLGVHPFYSTTFSIESFIFQLDQNPANREKVINFLISLSILEKIDRWAGVEYKIKRESAIAWDDYFSLSYVVHNVKLLRSMYASQLANR